MESVRIRGTGTGQSDILSGVTGAAAFVAMSLLLHMPLWLSALLAAGVYLGIRFVARPGVSAVQESLTEAELIQRIGQLVPAIANPRVRGRISESCGQAQRVLSFLDQHPEKAGAWRGVVRECLQSTLRIVERYVELS